MPSGIFYPVVSGDDGFAYEIEGSVGIGYNSMHWGEWSGAGPGTWVRFPNINILVNSVITEAFVRFVSYTDKATTVCNGNIYFNDIDDAIAPTNQTQFTALALTEAIVWNNIGAWVDGVQYDTPELKTILQAIISRSGWSSNNALQVILKDNGSSADTVRVASQIDYLSGTEKAELHVTWEDPPPPSIVLIDLQTKIDTLWSKYWLNTDIQIKSAYDFCDLLSDIQAGNASISDLKTFIDGQYPTWEKFLRLKYDHIPARNEINVSVDRPMTFRVYNPDPAFGIDITSFKVRLDEGVWYRYGDARFTFTKVNYREYLIYFNPPKLTYDKQIMAELYCEDHLNNPGIKLEIL